MKLALLSFILVLSGCATTVPVKASFPESVPELMKKCEQLKKVEINGPVSITDLLKVVVTNYGLYYECSTKVESWQDWYIEQRKIFESVK